MRFRWSAASWPPAVLSPCARADVDVATRTRFAELRAEAGRFEHGEGVSRDAVRAVELYCEAAREGDAEAQYNLGWMYANGRGVVRDDGLASLFFGMAAGQGHAPARNMLRVVGDQPAEMPECMRDAPLPEIDDTYRGSGFEEEFIATTPEQLRAVEIVHKLAPEYQINPHLALAIIRAESNFNPAAVSNRNAQGLMQLIPETAARFNVTKPFDPVQNIKGGLAYLRWLLAYFRGDVTLVVAAYNAGEGAVNKYRGVPPYAETRGYVQQIRAYYRKAQHPFDPRAAEPSPELARIRANAPS
ncbi:MAG: transglycosylase SLT domain-containing protein [Betaproteobacteria bacterium]|nr:transglycosylase SLT domain-containing protein [Betaproteobacteria bacterium]